MSKGSNCPIIEKPWRESSTHIFKANQLNNNHKWWCVFVKTCFLMFFILDSKNVANQHGLVRLLGHHRLDSCDGARRKATMKIVSHTCCQHLARICFAEKKGTGHFLAWWWCRWHTCILHSLRTVERFQWDRCLTSDGLADISRASYTLKYHQWRCENRTR